MSKRDYDVLEPLQHDGTRYEPGAVVEGLADKQAQPLLDAVPPVIRPVAAAADGGDAGEPTDPAERHAMLKAFMAEMDPPEDPRGSDVWTNGGKPEAGAVAAALGWGSVSARERDAAWSEVLAERQAGGGDS